MITQPDIEINDVTNMPIFLPRLITRLESREPTGVPNADTVAVAQIIIFGNDDQNLYLIIQNYK